MSLSRASVWRLARRCFRCYLQEKYSERSGAPPPLPQDGPKIGARSARAAPRFWGPFGAFRHTISITAWDERSFRGPIPITWKCGNTENKIRNLFATRGASHTLGTRFRGRLPTHCRPWPPSAATTAHAPEVDLVITPRIGDVGWIPALGTRGFHRPLSDPSTDVATIQSVTDETCQQETHALQQI
jgi:hypothetical protein